MVEGQGMTRWIALGIIGALLTGCGAKQNLQYREGKSPPTPVTSVSPPTFQQMMTRPPQAAPERNDEPLKKSQDRPDDKFDLPPPG